MPDRRTGEPVHDRGRSHAGAVRFRIEERACRAPGGDHLLSRPLAHTLRRSIAPDIGREDRAVPLVDRVTHRLSHEMVRDCVTLEPMLAEQRPFVAHVPWRRERLVDVEMVTPAGELDSIVAHLLDEWRELREGKI